MKKFRIFLLVCLFITALALCASAKTVYVAAGASGSGTEASPVGTVEAALQALDGMGGEIVVTNAVTVSDLDIPEQTGDLTFRATAAGKLTVTGTVTLAKNINANCFIFDLPIATDANGCIFYGGFNSVHFTESFAVDGYVDFWGGVSAPVGNSANTDEVTEDANLAAMTELPYSITVDNGIYRTFTAGNYRAGSTSVIGSIAAPLTVTVNGGTFTREVGFAVDSAIKNAYMFSLSGCSLLADDASLTINGGRFEIPLYVHGYLGSTGSVAAAASVVTYSDAKYYAADGDVTLTINGGTFAKKCFEISAEQTAATYNRLHRGNYRVTVGENAVFATDTLFDATQVKAYAKGDAQAILTAAQAVSYKRFDAVNGESKSYTEPLRIACIGDSITEGVGSSSYATRSYPARLLTKAVAAGQDVILSNYGNSGSKTMDFEGRHYNKSLAYILSMYETDADYILIGLGTNDARMTTYTYGYADRFYKDYTALLSGYGSLPSTKTVYNTSPVFRYDKRDIATVCNIYPLQKRVQEELNAAAIADGSSARYTHIDLYALTLNDYIQTDAEGKYVCMNDSVHPNDAGYAVYADVLYDAIFNGMTCLAGFKTGGDLYVSASGTCSIACTEDAPTNNLAIAMSRAADGATVHIIGTLDFTRMERADWGFSTPTGIKDFSIVGEGTDARLTINSDMFFVKGDLFMDNITLGTNKPTNKYAPLHICLGYNNVTFGENFKTLAPDGTQGGALLVAGVVTLPDDPASGWFNTLESVSFDRDCAIRILGGDYVGYIGGNALFASYKADGFTYPKNSLYGTYGGDMTVTLGEGITVGNDVRNGVVGQNYLTGSVVFTAHAWSDGAIRVYGDVGKVAESFDFARNTGGVTASTTLANEIHSPRDFNNDGSINIADVLGMLQCVIRVKPYDPAQYFYRSVDLLSVLELLRYVTQ